MNAYLQHFLHYESERKDLTLNTLTVMIVRFNIIIPILKNGQKILLLIIHGKMEKCTLIGSIKQ